MKTKYDVPTMDVVELEASDIVTISGGDEGTGEYDDWG